MRKLALTRYQEFERDLGPLLTRFAVADVVRRFHKAGDLHWSEGVEEENEIDRIARELTPEHGRWLAKNPSLEETNRLSREVAHLLADRGALDDAVAALEIKESPVPRLLSQAGEALGMERKTFAGEV